jgi:hypothetical protein
MGSPMARLLLPSGQERGAVEDEPSVSERAVVRSLKWVILSLSMPTRQCRSSSQVWVLVEQCCASVSGEERQVRCWHHCPQRGTR